VAVGSSLQLAAVNWQALTLDVSLWDLKSLAFRRPLPVRRAQPIARLGPDASWCTAMPWIFESVVLLLSQQRSGFQPTSEPTGSQPVGGSVVRELRGMDDRKRLLGHLLLPLSLCGLMLVVATTSKQMPIDLRWKVLAFGLILSMPGIVFMILTVPLRREEHEEDDDSDDLGTPSAGTDADSIAEGDTARRDEQAG
jgi:hypothetical protein